MQGSGLDSLTIDGDQIHLVHTVARRNGVDHIGLHHADLGTARWAPIAQIDPAKLAVGRWCRYGHGDAADHGEPGSEDEIADAEGDDNLEERPEHVVKCTGGSAESPPEPAYIRSISVALAMPPPSHIVCSA